MVDTIGRAKVIVETVIDKSSLDTSSGKIGKGIKTGALVGVAALGTLTVAGVHAFKAFEEGAAVSAKLSTVLGNMGKQGAAEDVEKLATALQRSTGFSDETIKSGQTLLATFSQVAASAGEAGGVFERASIAAVDLAATGFGSVESSSKALGKALQDPVKGITALGRAGVTFTEEQKALIEGFVKAGDAASAQAIVLKEVEKQVGGVGEASAKESVKISEAFGEIEESAGEALAALLGGGKGKNSLSGELFKVSDAISDLAKSKDWQNLGKNMRGFGKDTLTVASALNSAYKWTKNLTSVLPGLNEGLGDVAGGPIVNLIRRVADLVGVLKGLNKELDGNSGKIIGNKNNTDFGDSDFLNQITGSAGGGRSRGGLTLVGENGPEIVSLPANSYVHNNSEARRMAGASAASVNITNVFNGPESLAEARRRDDWAVKYGTRFGAATNAGAL